jgi:rubredoxin
MKRPRCPKCQFGNTTKLGEMVQHRETTKRWVSSICGVYWECPKCSHTWSLVPKKK